MDEPALKGSNCLVEMYAQRWRPFVEVWPWALRTFLARDLLSVALPASGKGPAE
jgi:hypothetical protein